MKIFGDLNAKLDLVTRRADTGLCIITGSSIYEVQVNDPEWLRVTDGGSIKLPSTEVGWSTVIEAYGADVGVYDESDVLLKTILNGKVYRFTRVSSSNWYMDLLEDTTIVGSRFVILFSTETFVDDSSEFWKIYIPRLDINADNENLCLFVYEKSGTSYISADAECIINNEGVVLRVPKEPDGRFDGKLVIVGTPEGFSNNAVDTGNRVSPDYWAGVIGTWDGNKWNVDVGETMYLSAIDNWTVGFRPFSVTITLDSPHSVTQCYMSDDEANIIGSLNGLGSGWFDPPVVMTDSTITFELTFSSGNIAELWLNCNDAAFSVVSIIFNT